MRTRAKQGIRKPNTRYGLSATTSPIEPRTVIHALADEVWRNSMSEEFNAQIRHGTWSLEPPSPHQNVVGTKWIHKYKYAADGSVLRPKSRLVAKGYTQRKGVDYSKTFSPVIKLSTICLILDVAVKRDWPIKQLGVNNAFLQGTLTEEVFITQPEGFVDVNHPDYVCRLHKPLYGLKQAPRAWYQELRNYLVSLGFVNSLADVSLFILKHGSTLIYVLVYVDDIIVTGNNHKLLQQTLDAFASRFSIKDPEDIHYFLGLEVHRTSKGLHLTQHRYILDLLRKCNMHDAKPVTTPMATSPKLSINSGAPLSDAKDYRATVGSLQYLAFTRPDISYAVNRLSQYMHRPTDEHWQAVKRLLRYLASTSYHRIFFHRCNTDELHAFSDADWAGDQDDYVST